MTEQISEGGAFPALRGFLREVDAIVDQSGPLPSIVHGVKDHLASLLKSRPEIPEQVRAAGTAAYARHLLYGDPQGRYEVVVMAWGPGQRTPVHDHAGIWCVEGVVEGVIDVTRYDITEEVTDGLVRMESTELIHAGLGACGALIPPVEYHRIANPYSVLALTMHVYGGRMRSCRTFEERADHLFDVHTRPLGFTSDGPALSAA